MIRYKMKMMKIYADSYKKQTGIEKYNVGREIYNPETVLNMLYLGQTKSYKIF